MAIYRWSKAHQRRCQSWLSLAFSLRAAIVPDGFSCWGRRDQARELVDEGGQTWRDYLLSFASFPSLRSNCLVKETAFRWFLTAGCFSPVCALRSPGVCGFPRPARLPCRVVSCLCFLSAAFIFISGTIKEPSFCGSQDCISSVQPSNGPGSLSGLLWLCLSFWGVCRPTVKLHVVPRDVMTSSVPCQKVITSWTGQGWSCAQWALGTVSARPEATSYHR